MSLWRVRHGLSFPMESLVVAAAAALGVTSITSEAMKPLSVPTTALIRSVPERADLDLETWTSVRDAERGIDFSVPPGWTRVGDRDRIGLVRGPGFLAGRDPDGSLITI